MLADLDPSEGSTDALEMAVALTQHHDSITGEMATCWQAAAAAAAAAQAAALLPRLPLTWLTSWPACLLAQLPRPAQQPGNDGRMSHRDRPAALMCVVGLQQASISPGYCSRPACSARVSSLPLVTTSHHHTRCS